MGCGVSKHSDMYGFDTTPYCTEDVSTRMNKRLKACNTDYDKSMMMMHMSLYGG